MRHFSRIISVCCTALLVSAVYAGAPNYTDPTIFLGPTLNAGFASRLSELSAYSVKGEFGMRNIRVGGTLGWDVAESQRIKVSAEYLSQHLTYSFFEGNSERWVVQSAFGADYGYEFTDYPYSPLVGINAYVSHAPSQSLNTDLGSYTSKTGTIFFTDTRHIAGVNAAGLSPGITLQPWSGAHVGFDLNYDSVQYQTNYLPGQNARGFGGTVRWNQVVADGVETGLSAAVRQPYNTYGGYVAMTRFPYLNDWALGLNAVYTIGKNKAPNTCNIGLIADYFLERNPSTSIYQRQAAESFLAWVTKPAVYVPQVLGVADERVTF